MNLVILLVQYAQVLHLPHVHRALLVIIFILSPRPVPFLVELDSGLIVLVLLVILVIWLVQDALVHPLPVPPVMLDISCNRLPLPALILVLLMDIGKIR